MDVKLISAFFGQEIIIVGMNGYGQSMVLEDCFDASGYRRFAGARHGPVDDNGFPDRIFRLAHAFFSRIFCLM